MTDLSKSQCVIEGCTTPERARGYCDGHYSRYRRFGLITNLSKLGGVCVIKECEGLRHEGNYCSEHFLSEELRLKLRRPVRPKLTFEEVNYRDALGRKRCGTCQEWFSEDGFEPSKVTSDGRKAKCRTCLKLWKRALKYRVTEEYLLDLYISQDGLCRVCRQDISEGFHVDHDHACCPPGRNGGNTCGQCNRGLLCSKCNRLLGHAGDSSDLLLAAASYLMEWKAKRDLG